MLYDSIYLRFSKRGPVVMVSGGQELEVGVIVKGQKGSVICLW